MYNTIVLNKDIEVLIVSAGGVGTTFLMKAIGAYRKINSPDNADGFKHLPLPPLSLNKDLKVIYIYGNPLMACLSLFRRGFQVVQSIKSQQYLEEQFTIPQDMSLDAYAAIGEEGHYFERHLNNWKDAYRLYPTLFIRYETLFEQVETIAEYLDLPKDFVEQFPAKQARKSNKAQLNPATLQALEKLYEPTAKAFAQLPDAFQKEKSLSIWSIIATQPYRRGLAKWFWKRLPLLRKVKNKLQLSNN